MISRQLHVIKHAGRYVAFNEWVVGGRRFTEGYPAPSRSEAAAAATAGWERILQQIERGGRS